MTIDIKPLRIAFYAPLKPPDHPIASGDRTMARLLVKALTLQGHAVEIAARLRSYDGVGDPVRIARLRDLGARLAERFVARCLGLPGWRPDLWFTYHPYYKAPDFIGPFVAERLGIPYVAAEASLAEKRSNGRWRLGHDATVATVRRADAVIGLNSSDHAGILPFLAAPERWQALKPFIETAPFAAARSRRGAVRQALASRWNLDPEIPWLVAVAMMRPGDKAQSYAILAAAAALVADRPWRLLIVGDGLARETTAAGFAACAERVAWLGRVEGEALAETVAACDLCAWPAINEAYGMALLEAQAAGVPVLAGASGGVPEIVSDGVTGVLVPPGDPIAFAAALAAMLDAPDRRRDMGRAAARQAAAEHDIAAGARRLDAILRRLVPAAA
jgi:glycosyltransferase involved in cell wall biosynthesis